MTPTFEVRDCIWKAVTSPDSLLFIAGPCVIESEQLICTVARELAIIARELGVTIVFKASYDKANRTSIRSFRGPGLEAGLRMLEMIRQRYQLPTTTDVHSPEEASRASEVVDIIQIPAFLCRQTDLILAAGRTGRIVNVKKGQFLAPAQVRYIAEKLVTVGCDKFMVTERGFSFGYGDLVVDMRSFPIIKKQGVPVLFDATHSVQTPGALGERSGGQREFVPVLARAAVAAGADGLFFEVHPDPDNALSDGPNMLPLASFRSLVQELVKLKSFISRLNGAAEKTKDQDSAAFVQ